MSILLLQNLNMGGTETSPPVGPGADRALMLVSVGRCLIGAMLGVLCAVLGGG